MLYMMSLTVYKLHNGKISLAILCIYMKALLEFKGIIIKCYANVISVLVQVNQNRYLVYIGSMV